MDTKLPKVSVRISVVAYKKSKYWIAYAPSLRIFGRSDISEKDALKDFDKAVDVFLHVHETRGTLQTTLENLGWTRKEDGNTLIEEPKFFNIPLDNLIGGHKAEVEDRLIQVPA